MSWRKLSCTGFQELNKNTESVLRSKCWKLFVRSSSRAPLKVLNPLLDDSGLLRVGGREEYSKKSYDTRHPLIIHSKHLVAKLLIRSEHEHLLHAGALLLTASLSSQFHIIRGCDFIRSLTRNCVTCLHKSARPQTPIMGLMPPRVSHLKLCSAELEWTMLVQFSSSQELYVDSESCTPGGSIWFDYWCFSGLPEVLRCLLWQTELNLGWPQH